MGEGDVVSEKPEAVANGNAEVENKPEAVMNNKVEHSDGVKEIEVDKHHEGEKEIKEDKNGDEVEETEEDNYQDGEKEIKEDKHHDKVEETEEDKHHDGVEEIEDKHHDREKESEEDKHNDGEIETEEDKNNDGEKETEEDGHHDGEKEMEEDGHHDGVKEMEEDKQDDVKIEAQNMDVDKEEISRSNEVDEIAQKQECKEETQSGENEKETEGKVDKINTEEKKEDVDEETENAEDDKVEMDVDGMKEKEENLKEVKKGKRSRSKSNSRQKNLKKKNPVEEKEPQTPKEKNTTETKPSVNRKQKEGKNTVDRSDKEPKTPMSPIFDRPVRERKSVERLVAVIEKDSAKEFYIAKGRGTALKEIPNVAFKLSRKKTDDTLKLLHTILYGRRAKAVLWNMDTLQTETTLEEHQYLITDVRFRPNSTQLATASFDKSVRLWDAANPSYCLQAYTVHTSHVMSLNFHPKKNDLFCFCDSKNEIRYWSISPFACTRISKQGGSAQVRFQPISGHLLAAASDKVVSIFDVENDRQTHSFQGHSGVVNYLCWDLNGDLLASVSEDSIKVWSLASGECIHELNSNGNQFHSCVFHPSYSALLVIGGLRVIISSFSFCISLFLSLTHTYQDSLDLFGMIMRKSK